MLDGFGLKARHPPAPEDDCDIIDRRYERGSTVVAANRALEEWPDLFWNPLLASAGLHRLTNRAHAVVITGASLRAPGPRCAEEAVTIETAA